MPDWLLAACLPATPPALCPAAPACPCLPPQVGIIRQVEVDIGSEIERYRTAFREESSKLKHWSAKAKEVAKQIVDKDGEQLDSSQ